MSAIKKVCCCQVMGIQTRTKAKTPLPVLSVKASQVVKSFGDVYTSPKVNKQTHGKRSAKS